jgi:hypothetical protein
MDVMAGRAKEILTWPNPTILLGLRGRAELAFPISII